MRMIGVCRFSYPALGGFKRMHDTIEEREAYLYDPERMELRFRHFEALNLASISAQKDEDFTYLIVIGENLPKPYYDRLHDLTASTKQIKIIPMSPMRHRAAMQAAIQYELGDNDVESIQFRLDDDDAVGRNFVRMVRRRARQSAAMRQGWNNMVFEFSSGYSVKLSEQGILKQKVETPFLACGLAVLFQPGATRTIMNYGHHKLHHEMPTLIDPNTVMYLRAVHDDNDSKVKVKEDKLEPLTEEEQTFFEARFNVTNEHVRSVFAAQAEPLGTA